MKWLAWTSWGIAIVWMVLIILGAGEFQDLYGATSGLQVILLGLAIALVPAGIGWWAYRKANTR